MSCDDGHLCTDDSCEDGRCRHTAVACNDENSCTFDTCRADVGCTYVPRSVGTVCNDGNPCTGPDTCNASAQCIAGPPASVNDGNVCTDDACDPELGITHVGVAGRPCPEADACTFNETCDISGICVVDVLDCDDGLMCNGVEQCNYFVGCQSGPPPNLSDGVACTVDTCSEASGIVHTPSHPACNDSNACTTDFCSATQGCLHPVSSATFCEDGSSCTLGDTCDNGACIGGPGMRDCNDFNPCTTDSCSFAEDDCEYTPVADGTACGTSGETCQQGSCIGGCTPSAHAPEIQPVGNLQAEVRRALSVQVVATDIDVPTTLTYALVGTALPAGLTLNASTGRIAGTPTAAALAGTGVTTGHVIRVSDGCLTAHSAPFSISVRGVPLPEPTVLFDFDDIHVSGSTLTSAYGGITGTLSGGVTSGHASATGEQFDFDGTGQVTLGTSSSPLKTAGAMTVSMTLDARAPTAQTYYSCGIAGAEGGNTAYAFRYGVDAAGHLVAFHEDSAHNDMVASSTDALGASGAQHAAFIRSGNAYVTYLNGLPDSGGIDNYAQPPGNFGDCVVRIGSDDGAGGFADGLVDELAVWHRFLAPDQIATLAWLQRNGMSLQSWIHSYCSDLEPNVYWSLDTADVVGGVIEDTGSDGIDGVITGGVTAGVSSQIGQGIRFDGSTGYVTAPLSMPSAFSLMFWINPVATPATGFVTILNQANGPSAASGWGIRLGQFGTTQLYFHQGGVVRTLALGAAPNRPTWMAVTFDGATFRSFSGGVLIGSTPASSIQLGTSPLVLGRDSFTNGSYYNGLVDAFTYFDHVVSDDVMWQHYSCGNQGVASTH